jgi:hypothetical protein
MVTPSLLFIFYQKSKNISNQTFNAKRFQEVAQSTGTTPNEAEVISSNPSFPSCADMSKKIKTFNAKHSTPTN